MPGFRTDRDVAFDRGELERGPKGRPGPEDTEQAADAGLWFGGDLRSCWKSVYATYTLELLRHEEEELWAERERIALARGAQDESLVPIRMRIALVEDRLRELVGSYS